MIDDNENLDANKNLNNEDKPNKEITNELLGEFADLLSEVENEGSDSSNSTKLFDRDEPVIEQKDAEPVTVQPVQFAAFDVNTQTSGEENQNLDLIQLFQLFFCLLQLGNISSGND